MLDERTRAPGGVHRRAHEVHRLPRRWWGTGRVPAEPDHVVHGGAPGARACGSPDVEQRQQPPGRADRGVGGVTRPEGGGRMTKWMRLLAVLSVLAILATACGGDDGGDGGGGGGGTPDLVSYDAAAQGEGGLSLIAWPGYTEDDWVKPFEKESGCDVTVKPGNTS